MQEVRLIDANSLIGFLHNQTFIDGDDRSLVYRWIEEQPTIDAEPVRHGRWEKAADKQYCTECRAVTKVRNAPFCWHCGAKIDLRIDDVDSVMMGGADNG